MFSMAALSALFAVCLLAIFDISESKGTATLSVLLPQNAFFSRQFTADVDRSIKGVSSDSQYDSLTAKYSLEGTIDFATGKARVKKAFCERLTKSHPSAFLYMPYNKTAALKKSVIKGFSKYKIPVLLWDRTGTSSEKWKGSGGLVLHLLPTVEQMANAFADLTKRFGWTNLAVIYDESSGAGEFVRELKTKSPSALSHRLKDNDKDLSRALFRLRVAKTQAVFLYLKNKQQVSRIFKVAKSVHMIGKYPAWILSNLAIPKDWTPDEFPAGIMGLDVTKTFDDTSEGIKTAVTIWARALKDLVKKKPDLHKDIFVSHGTCSKLSTFSAGQDIYTEMYVHGSSDSKEGGVKFVGDGASNARIRIVNLNLKRRWFEIGDWNSVDGLDIYSIIGPGGKKLPPCPKK